MGVTDEKLIKLKQDLQNKLLKREMTVDLISKATNRNRSMYEIRVNGLTKLGHNAESSIIFNSDTFEVKFAAGNVVVCDWIVTKYLRRPPYDIYNFIIAFGGRY